VEIGAWIKLGFAVRNLALKAHNLKVVGSNPTPATKLQRVISYLQSALRGVFCVAKSPGSTAEARGRAGLRNNAKSQRQISSWHLLFLDIHVSPYEFEFASFDATGLLKPQ
jgi:hypothetical protein